MRKLLLLLLAYSVSLAAVAQDQVEPKKGFDKEKLFFGGSFSFEFGSSYDFVNVTPLAGYRFNKFFAAGTGINFSYYNSDLRVLALDYKEHYSIVGLNVFGRFYPVKFLLLQVQPELNYGWGKHIYYDGSPDQKLDPKFIPALLVGGGFAIPLGRRKKTAITILLQYDLVQDPSNIYGDGAFLTLGINF